MSISPEDFQNIYVPRVDYFLIWGNGLPYQDNIFNIIRDEDAFSILAIIRHKPRTIKKLVRLIYSHDYAPLQHLAAKTEYLLSSTPDVIFIFVNNLHPHVKNYGDGLFRHVESQTIKRIKDAIRNEFNPREKGIRTEDHVIHASDNENQVDKVLKYLGYSKGIKLFHRSENWVLDIPYYLRPVEKFQIKQINLENVRGRILKGDRTSYSVEPCHIDDTPHYAFVCGSRLAYIEYIKNFIGGPLTSDYSERRFENLINQMRYLHTPYETSYLLTKELAQDDYILLDGLHRASILYHRGSHIIPAVVVK